MWGGAEKKRKQKGENTNIVRYIKDKICKERLRYLNQTETQKVSKKDKKMDRVLKL